MIRMRQARRAALVGGVVAGCLVVGQAVAASSGPAPIPDMKQRTATVANVKGLKFVIGRTAVSRPMGSAGVVSRAESVALCPKGTHALSGGWNSADNTTDPVTISSNEVGKGLNRWLVIAEDMSTSDSGSGFVFEATATCG